MIATFHPILGAAVELDLARAHFRDVPRAKGNPAPVKVDPGTVERPDLEALVAHYKTKLRLEHWRIVIKYVPDLARAAGPVWGLCVADSERATATILIRDPETPPPGATVERAIAEVAKTVLHELLHCRIDGTESSPLLNEQATHALEEALLAARGTAREQEFARKLRARTAPVRAKGTAMDPKIITEALDALIAGDAEKCAELLKGLIAAAAGAAPGAEPDGDEIPTDPENPPMGKPAVPPKPGQPPADESPMARARAVATASIELSAKHARSASRSLVTDAIHVKIQRARSVDGIELAAEDERDLLACDSTEAAEKLLGVMKRHATAPRARSGAEPGAKTRTVGDGGDPIADIEAKHEVKVDSLEGREAVSYQSARTRGLAHARAALDGIANSRRHRGVSVATGVKS